MSKYAVIQLLGKQHQVTEGETIVVDSVPQEEGQKFDVTDVLLVVDGDKISVGQPTVEKAKVTLSVVAQGKGDKIRVAKYKSKSRYRKTMGHRQLQSTLKVEKITA
ncbi:MAG: 50S ribosomal protein L21 [Patescibacteria group bacterium]